MAYKCKGCGYRFKPSDSDLCPECFTARDDISCGTFGDGSGSHSHFKDSPAGDDFIADQLREESRLTRDEFSEELSTFTDSFKRGFGDEIPPNTFQRTPRPQPQRVNYSAVNSYSNSSYAPYRRPTPAPQSRKRSSPFLTIMIIMFLAVPYLYTTIHKAVNEYRAANIEKFVLEATADNFTLDKKLAGSAGINSDYEGSLTFSDQSLMKYNWYALKCDITLSDSDYKVNKIFINGVDADSNTRYSWSIENKNDMYGSGSELHGVPLCVTPVYKYIVALECENSEGSGYTIRTEFDLLDAVTPFESEPFTEPLDEPVNYSYNYEPGYFYHSIADETGSGIKLHLAETPHELVDNEEVGEFVFNDESLSTADMKLCKIELMLGGKPSVFNEFGEIELAGLDANGAVAYEYSTNGDPVLPINSRVQYYALVMTVADRDGFDRQLGYKFYSNDLYNTIND